MMGYKRRAQGAAFIYRPVPFTQCRAAREYTDHLYLCKGGRFRSIWIRIRIVEADRSVSSKDGKDCSYREKILDSPGSGGCSVA
jgi:hypothetical protein